MPPQCATALGLRFWVGRGKVPLWCTSASGVASGIFGWRSRLSPRTDPVFSPLPTARSKARFGGWRGAVAGLAATGCVHVYQPMGSLHQPVVVDPTVANFQDLRLVVDCVPGDMLNAAQANILCERVGTLFENQGAEVHTQVLGGQAMDAGLIGGQADDEPAAPPPTDLRMQLRAREVHEDKHPLSWVLCAFSFTLVPGRTERTFAQDVVIYDENGFLLLRETLEGRLVHRFGGGVWLGNALLDLVYRDTEDEILGKAANRDLSGDLYLHLSQLVFNAKMRWQVHQDVTVAGPTP